MPRHALRPSRGRARFRAGVLALVTGLVGAMAVVLVVDSTAGAGTVPPSQVQAKYGYTNRGTGLKVTLKNSVKPGNLLAVYVVWSNTGSAALTDNRSDGFLVGGSRMSWADSYSSEVFYARSVVGGSTTVTASFSSAVSFGVVYVHEYAGLDRTAPFDRSVGTTGSGSTLNSGAVTTSGAGELIFAAGASVGAVSAGSAGYTVRSMAEGNLVEDRVADSAGSYTATAPHSGGGWVMHAVAFNAASTNADSVVSSSPAGTSTSASATPTRAPSSSSTTAAPAPSTATSSVAPGTSSVPPPSSNTPSSSTPTSSAPATTTPPASSTPPSTAGWPGPGNTGTPAGVSLHDCPLTITTPGTYDACHFGGDVSVRASNVTISRSLINGSVDAGSAGSGQTGLVIQDTTLDCGCMSTSDTSTPVAIMESDYTLLRVNLMHSGHGAAVQSNVVIRDSWIHDLGGNTQAHKDGIFSGDGSNVLIQHNTIDCNDGSAAGCTSAIGLLTDFAPITHYTIDNNLLNTIGSYCLYGSGGPSKAYSSSYITVTNNHFGRADHANCGYYGPVTYFDKSQPGMTWSGNVWDDNGAPVTAAY